MVGKEKKLTYDELLIRYRDLELRVTRFFAIEQKLINIRHKLDNEIVRHKRMHSLNQKAQEDLDDQEYCNLMAEAIVDVFEVEYGILIYRIKDENSYQSWIGTEGIDSIDPDLIFERLVPLCIKTGQENLLNFHENDLASLNSVLPLKQAYGKFIDDPQHNLELFLLAGISEKGASIYEPLEKESDAIFSLFTQQVYVNIKNRLKRRTIKNQIKKMESYGHNLEVISQCFLNLLKNQECSIESFLKKGKEILRADLAVYVRGQKAIYSNPIEPNELNNSDCNICYKLEGSNCQCIFENAQTTSEIKPCQLKWNKSLSEELLPLAGHPPGWLGVYYQSNTQMDENDLQIFKIISAIVSAEEQRKIAIKN
ncbi:MAG: hypothetical protein K1X82_01640 [Bacteroidia bacterium]|nr:hypothetical protein [Bacteroidia bacterium]